MLLVSAGSNPETYNISAEIKATHSMDGTIAVSTTIDLPDDDAKNVDVGWTLWYVNSNKTRIPCKVVSVSRGSSGDTATLDISCIDRASFNAQKYAGIATFGSSTEGHTAKEYFDWINTSFSGKESNGLAYNVSYEGSDDSPHYVAIGNSTGADALSAIIKDGGYEVISDGMTLHIYDNISTGNYRVFSSDILMSQCTFEQDASSLITIQEGVGKDGITATYQSPLSDKYGLLYGAPVNDDSIETVAKLQAKLKASVEATYAESITATYQNDAGYNLDNVQIGDIINFVDNISGLHIAKRCIKIDYTYDDLGRVIEGSITAGKPDAAERTAKSLQDLANAAEKYEDNTGSDLADDIVSMGGTKGIGDIGNDMYGNLGDAGGSGLNGGNTNGDGSASDGVVSGSGSGTDDGWSTKTKQFRFFTDDQDYADHSSGSNDYDRVGIIKGNGTYVGEGGPGVNNYTTNGPGAWSIGGMFGPNDEKLNGDINDGTGFRIGGNSRLIFFPRSAGARPGQPNEGKNQSAALLGGSQLILAVTNKDLQGNYDDDHTALITLDHTFMGSSILETATNIDTFTNLLLTDGNSLRNGFRLPGGVNGPEMYSENSNGNTATIKIEAGNKNEPGHFILKLYDGHGGTAYVDLVKLISDNGWWEEDGIGTSTTTTTKSVHKLTIETVHDKAKAGEDAMDAAGDLSGSGVDSQYLKSVCENYTSAKSAFTSAFDAVLYLNVSSSDRQLSDVKKKCDNCITTLNDLQQQLHTIGSPTLSESDQEVYNRIDICLRSVSGAFTVISESLGSLLGK